jgi:hypothetical protein
VFHFLLVVEHVAVLLLFWTWLIAFTAPRWRHVRFPLRGFAFLVLLAWTGGLAGAWIFLATLYPPLRAIAIISPLLLFLGFFVGSTTIWVRGRRLEGAQPAAVFWPIRRIALVLAITLVVHFVTWANFDAAVQRDIASLRAEAYRLAESVAPPDVSDRENAAVLYQQVFDGWDLTHRQNEWPEWFRLGESDEHVTAESAKKFLAARRHDIDLLRRAAAMPRCRFEHDYYRPAPDILIPEIQNLRDASRLLSANAKAHFAAGRIDEAVRDLDAMWGMADHAAGQPFLVSFLVGLAIEQQTIATLEWGIGQGDWKGKKLPPLAMEDGGIADRIRLHRALAFEESMGVLMSCDAAQGPADLWQPNFGMADTGAVWLIGAAYRVFPFFGQDVALYRQKMRRLRQIAEMLPMRPLRPDIQSELKNVKGLGLIPQLLLPAQEQLIRRSSDAEVPRQTARLGIQAFRYQLEQGKAPAKLEELVPGYIPFVPRDPYSKEPFRFVPAKDADPWIVYSIGPDGIDGGGVRMDGAGKGDMVFSPRRKTVPKEE